MTIVLGKVRIGVPISNSDDMVVLVGLVSLQRLIAHVLTPSNLFANLSIYKDETTPIA